MRRELPQKPNLEHLKSQAKDLLDAHRRGEPEAMSRIRAAVPAFASKSNADIARMPFALHDAQSAIAREYGFASWAELRTKVTASEPDPSAEEAAFTQAMAALNMPPDLQAAVREVIALRGTQTDEPTPPSVPVLPLRNAVVFPGAVIPLDISRPSSMRALEVAMQSKPPLVGVFAQRAVETEQPTRDELHPTGSLCIVRILRRVSDGPMPGPSESRNPNLLAWVMVEGLRFVSLESLDQVDPYYRARIADTTDEPADAQQVDALAVQLREMAHRFVNAMPANREQIHAVIDKATEARQLADLVMAHLAIPVADMASYAQETQLSRRLDRAIAVLGNELAKIPSPPA